LRIRRICGSAVVRRSGRKLQDVLISMDTGKRYFTPRQKRQMLIRARFKCEMCFSQISYDNCHADHRFPWSLGGRTTLSNGQALCAPCNILKGDSLMGMLRWQKNAFDIYKTRYDVSPIHVQVAGTGSGKTAAGAAMASYAFMREAGRDPLIIVAAPFRSIKKGWQKWLKKSGISRTTTNNNRAADQSLEGIICTFASLGEILRMVSDWDRAVILVLDEFHHLEEEGKWTEPLREVRVGDGDLIVRAILLSGTPWHETGSLPTSLVAYDEMGYVKHDDIYTYGDAVNEDDGERNVVPIEFRFIDGVAEQEVLNKETGEVVDIRYLDTQSGMKKDDPLTPFVDFGAHTIHQYDAVTELIDRAVQRLDQVRAVDGTEYAGGIFITMFSEQAEAVKHYLRKVHKKNAVVVKSDDPKAHDAIETFSESHDQEWIIAINMISEGVDVPRLKVLGDLTNKKTLMHVIQRWGRVLRRVRKPDNSFATNPSAYVYAINHPFLREVAQKIEDEVRLAKKSPASGGEAPEAKNQYKTRSLEFRGETAMAHGEAMESRVADLAQWLWDTNWRGIRSGRRGHTDCAFIARNMITDGNVPTGYTERKRAESNDDGRSYDDKKQTAITQLSTATARLAHVAYGGDYSYANNRLNEAMGVKKWDGKVQPLELIEKRIELAGLLTAQGQAA